MTELLYSHTSGRRLARSAVWNFAGLAVPLLVGVVAIPWLIEGMGKERFGLLAIIWMGVGYFSLFDMGLGRALTKLVAERLGDGRTDNLGKLIWTAFSLIAGLGFFGAALVFFSAEPLIRHVFNMDPRLQDEAIVAFRVLGIGLPIVVLTSAIVGILEAHQRFGTIAAVRIPLGGLTFAAPLITLQFNPSLVWATAALLAVRLAAVVVYFLLAVTVRSELKRPRWPDRAHMGPLLHFGGWLTVTNIVGPVMVYFDRFLIAAVLTMTAVTYYVTPYEVLSRTQILAQAVMGVVFPAFTLVLASDRARLANIYRQTTDILLLLMLPVTAGFFLLAPEALHLWLGPDFSEKSTPVAQWLALGLLINALAKPSFTLLQSAGRPDLVAKAHLVELVPYMTLLWLITSAFGIAGAAAAWSLRVLVDTLILNEMARRTVPEIHPVALRTYGIILVVTALFAAAWFIKPLLWRTVLLFAAAGYATLRAWPIITQLTLPARRSSPLV